MNKVETRDTLLNKDIGYIEDALAIEEIIEAPFVGVLSARGDYSDQVTVEFKDTQKLVPPEVLAYYIIGEISSSQLPYLEVIGYIAGYSGYPITSIYSYEVSKIDVSAFLVNTLPFGVEDPNDVSALFLKAYVILDKQFKQRPEE
jgi:hypothetical protein